MNIRALTVAAMASLMAGQVVAQETEDANAECDAGFRLFSHAEGATCIPQNPERILAPDDDSHATPLLDIGAPIIGTGFRVMDDGTRYVRGAVDIFGENFVAESDLIDIGNPNEPDLEAIAATEPDLIIVTEHQANLLDQFEAIAPTVVVPGNMPFLDHIALLADAAGMSGTFNAELARYEDRIEKAKDLIGDPGAISVSRFDLWDDGIWYYPNWGAIDQVINDIGFDKPVIQAEATSSMSGVSFEQIQQFDGDILISSYAARFGQTIGMLQTQWDSVAPFWRRLEGVESGNNYWYERDVLVGYTFESLDRSIEFLTALTAGRTFDDTMSE